MAGNSQYFEEPLFQGMGYVTQPPPEIEGMTGQSDPPTGEAQLIEPTIARQGLIARNKRVLGFGALAACAMVAAPQVAETVEAIGANAPWLIAAYATTEVAWFSGAAMMVVSAGKNIGNPFRLHSRLKEAITDIRHSKLFRAGLLVNIIGELGTAAAVVGGSVAYLPPSSWPMSLAASALIMSPGVALWPQLFKASKRKTEIGDESK